jgi:hypothetical protein
MPRKRQSKPEEIPDIDVEDEDELEERWTQDFQEDFPRLDDFDLLEEWLDNEEDWDEDKYGESH